MKPQQSKRKRTLRKYLKSLKYYKNLNEGIRVSDQRSERNEAQRGFALRSGGFETPQLQYSTTVQ